MTKPPSRRRDPPKAFSDAVRPSNNPRKRESTRQSDEIGFKTGRPFKSRTQGARTSKRPAAAFQERALNADGVEVVHIFGLHAVEAALRNPARAIVKIMASENASLKIADALKARAVTVEVTSPKALDKLLGADTVHQGVLLETAALPEPELSQLVSRALTSGPILVLDQITDPHNVGAILRSAAVFGSAGVVMTRRNSPALSGVLAKSASGALEHVPVHVAQNLARSLGELTDQGVQTIGLDGEGETVIEDIDFSGPSALVLGAEGKGLRHLTRERCSVLSRIGARGALSSLNVSNAAAVSLHIASLRRRDT